MSGETQQCPSPWTVDTLKTLTDEQINRVRGELAALKELLQAENRATAVAVVVARTELERRVELLNNLRTEVENDRAQFVKTDVYAPAHEELRRQRVTDAEKITIIQGDVKSNATDIAGMKNSLMWMTRLIVGALVMGVIAYAFQALTGK
jgi:hypothetical protein